MPPWPKITLYDRQMMMATPICDSIVRASPLVHSSGATASTSAKPPHSSQRPTFHGLK